MFHLEDENPYLVLGLAPGASRAEVTRAFARKNRGTAQQRHRARQAFDALRQAETRRVVDALTPRFDKEVGEVEQLAAGLPADSTLDSDLLKAIPPRQVLEGAILHSALAAIAFTTRQIARGAAGETPAYLEMSQDFNGLDKFLEAWLP
jgi:hypothetical protein